MRGRIGLVAAVTTWLGAVSIGLALVAQYDNTAGATAAGPAQWPMASGLARDPAGVTLVMLAHPRCTCTRASLAELAEIMARARHRPRAYVVFVRPGQLADGWETSDLLGRASRIPGVTIVRDDTGAEADAFRAETSGQIFLYDGSGRLRFSGGTTRSRGHAGDNVGRATILAILNHEQPPRSRTSVFGCSLFASGDRHDPAEAIPHDDHHH